MDSSPFILLAPSTPNSSRGQMEYQPFNSSPLASSPCSPKSSPLFRVQERRKFQYKSTVPSTPSRSAGRHENLGCSTSPSSSVFQRMSSEGTQKTFLRERFKARCLQRAAVSREKAVRGKRFSGSANLFGEDLAMEDEEEDDETIMQDDLFRRIMFDAQRRANHAYRVSYSREVGSSFDPDMEDISAWEQALSTSNSANPQIASTSTPSLDAWVDELSPEDLDDDELEAYAEELARRAEEADLVAGVSFEELFADDLEEELAQLSASSQTQLKPSIPSTYPDEHSMDLA